MSEIKFTPEEINAIKTIQQEYSELALSLGQLELEKLVFKGKEETLHSLFKSVSEKEKQIIKDLNEKYGVGSLNLDTGTFTPNP